MNKLVILAAGLILGLSACGTADIDSEAVQTVAGQVAGYDGPAGVLEATTGFIKLPQAGTGSISANGTFEFTFEESLQGFAGMPITPPGTCTDLSISDPEASALSIGGYDIVVDGRITGTLSQSQSGAQGSAGVPETFVSRAYVDREVTLKGACTFSVLEIQFMVVHDVAYQKGWNTVLTTTTFSDDGLTANSKVTLASASDIKDIAWSY